MKTKIQKPKKTQGYGYVGIWDDDTIGWRLPHYLHRHDARGSASKSHDDEHGLFHDDDRLYLCRITIEPILDKKNRPITRFANKIVK